VRRWRPCVWLDIRSGKAGSRGRERIRGPGGACLSLRDTLNQVKRGAVALDGRADFQVFEQELLAFGRLLLLFLEHHEALRGAIELGFQYDSAPDEDADEH
jgi:hypothetical protein